MKYALVDSEKKEALPELVGYCPVCYTAMRPRCGKFRMAHWAHPPGSIDHRWEPETEWHRKWKGDFPVECQEVVFRANNGERHFADVRTAHGRVLEFQNSPISEQERRSREAFYRPMYWIVNGQRLKGDRPQFSRSLLLGRVVKFNPLTIVVPTKSCMLLRKWTDSRVPVLFDFGQSENDCEVFRFRAPVLWYSSPKRSEGIAVLRPIYRERFLKCMIKNEPLKGIDFSTALELLQRFSSLQVNPEWQYRRRPSAPSFEQYMVQKHRERARRRF